MRGHFAGAAILFATALPLSALAEKPAAAGPAAAQPAAKVKPVDFVIPEIGVDELPIGDVVEFLRLAVPDFKVVLVYSDPARTDYPKVTLHLKQASLDQVLQIFQTAYQIHTSWISGPSGDHDIAMMHVGEPAGPKVVGHASTVHVYNLSPIVGALGGKSFVDSLNNVLSLIKAALHEAGGSEPVLQVHEATMTLIFKGSADQQAAVEDVLNALGFAWRSGGG